MRNKTLWILWANAYFLCALLGFVPNPQGAIYALLVGAAMLFFLPPGVLLYRAAKAKDRKTLSRLRFVSILWLSLTLLLLVVNLATVGASAAAGTALYYLLVFFSSPMICGQIWVLSLFLFALILTTSHHCIKSLPLEGKVARRRRDG